MLVIVSHYAMMRREAKTHISVRVNEVRQAPRFVTVNGDKHWRWQHETDGTPYRYYGVTRTVERGIKSHYVTMRCRYDVTTSYVIREIAEILVIWFVAT